MDGIGSAPPRPDPVAERMVLALGTAMRQAREQATALLQLVEQVPTSDGKGRHVNYRA